jgi:hypothetical protein
MKAINPPVGLSRYGSSVIVTFSLRIKEIVASHVLDYEGKMIKYSVFVFGLIEFRLILVEGEFKLRPFALGILEERDLRFVLRYRMSS